MDKVTRKKDENENKGIDTINRKLTPIVNYTFFSVYMEHSTGQTISYDIKQISKILRS